jgi:DNA-binding response OmpR family regulator
MSAKAKILIVEDEAAVASMMAILLKHAGCEASVAYNGKAGMKLATEIKFDLIALDIDLPDVNGLMICRELKQRHFSRHTPIVFISGRLLEEDIQLGLELGAVDYITKPFGANDFVRRILAHMKTQINSAEKPQNAVV